MKPKPARAGGDGYTKVKRKNKPQCHPLYATTGVHCQTPNVTWIGYRHSFSFFYLGICTLSTRGIRPRSRRGIGTINASNNSVVWRAGHNLHGPATSVCNCMGYYDSRAGLSFTPGGRPQQHSSNCHNKLFLRNLQCDGICAQSALTEDLGITRQTIHSSD